MAADSTTALLMWTFGVACGVFAFLCIIAVLYPNVPRGRPSDPGPRVTRAGRLARGVRPANFHRYHRRLRREELMRRYLKGGHLR